MPSDESDADAADESDADAADHPFVDGQTAALRDATAGPLFSKTFRPGEGGTDAGLVAGEPSDPVLVAGVGYPLLGDLALGTVVAYQVADWDLPHVAVADCSHTPIAAYQTITAGDHETVLLVGAEKRGGELNDGTPSENPGRIRESSADEYEVSDDEVVERVGESAMGSNTVENVLVVATAFGDLPNETRVLTVEPGYDSWGLNVDEFTDPVEDALEAVLDRLLDRIEDAVETSSG